MAACCEARDDGRVKRTDPHWGKLLAGEACQAWEDGMCKGPVVRRLEHPRTGQEVSVEMEVGAHHTL